jgi:N-acetyl-gamma-glutamyl-phosphate reductase
VKRRVAIVGASGYTGRELLALLRRHAHLVATEVMSARTEKSDTGKNDKAGEAPSPPMPGDVAIVPYDEARLSRVDGVFLCTPHGAAAKIAAAALAAGCKVVDLSADFRLRSPDAYARTYGQAHPAPALLGEAVYGLTEHARDAVRRARLCANPGCYPTSVLLPLLPLLAADLLDPQAPIVADSKSGTSGAGKTPSERTHFGNVHENFLAYGVGSHRHLPEIWQAAGTDRIAFVPHLLPTFRGILTTLYLRPRAGVGEATLRSCLQERYAHEPFVRVYGTGLPELHAVQHTNECHVAVASCGPLLVVVAAIDNLLKGASGQALQNMNVMLGLAETEGLR